MKQSKKFSGVLGAALVTMFVSPVPADDDAITARLTGYQETPLTLNSPGSGEFKARVGRDEDEASIDFELTYRDLLASPPTQSHIHFGRPATSGGIVLFLCTNLAPPVGVPTPQHCPAAPATITGTLTAADVIPLAGQGIDSGAAGFAEMLKAIRAGAAYANVHTPRFLGGEIRGALKRHKEEDDRDK